MMSTPRFTWQSLALTYAAAIPMDLVHAFSTVVFLFLISQPLLEKLERMKIKYGLIERAQEPSSDLDAFFAEER